MDINDLSIFNNCLEVKAAENGLIPLRFTQKQLAEYAQGPRHRIHSLSQAGVCIDVLTDTSFLKFDYIILEYGRNWHYFDIYCDGVWVDSIGSDSIPQTSNHFYFELPKHQNPVRLTVYLPQLVQIEITNIEVASRARVERIQPFSRNLLCLGDSITQGMEAYHPSLTYPVLLSRFLNMNLLNQAVGAYVFNAASLDREIPFHPDLITVAYGTNDWDKRENHKEFRQKCFEYFDALKSIFPGVPIVALTPLWRHDWEQPKQTGTFIEISAAIREICSGFEITVIDGLTLTPNMPQFLGDQTLHPNDTGFLYLALNLAKQITSIIETQP